MPIVVSCHSCGGRFNAPDEADGKSVKCPKCGARLEVNRPEVITDPELEKLLSSQGKSAPPPETSPQFRFEQGEANEQLQLSCPHCGKMVSVTQIFVNANVRCAYCKRVFTVSQDSASIAPPPLPPPSVEPQSAAPPPSDMERVYKEVVGLFLNSSIHRQRLVIAAAAGAGMLATFLPWFRVPILGSIYGTAAGGWITLALFIPAMVLVFRGNSSEPIIGSSRLKATVPAGIAVLIGLWKIVSLQLLAYDNPFAMATQIRSGIFFLVGAGLVLIFMAWKLAKHSQQ